MEAWSCPRCGSSTVIPGQVVTGDGRALCFRPNGMRGWLTTIGIPLTFSSCWSCGHTWTSLAPEQLRAFIDNHGQEVARQYRDTIELGPDHDLPDCHEAREAARLASEIDGLVLVGRHPEATRRYRELTHCTWDQALKALGGWHELDRSKKLALFGWHPKDKTQGGDSALLDHPLRDRLLDG